MGADFVQLSLVPMVVAVMAAMACALIGNFLILRRQAMIGDAIGHSVLPGIVLAFVLTGSSAAFPMFAGALLAALAAAALIEGLRRLGRVDPGAAMGVVFTAMFALGVLLVSVLDMEGVHLDAEHALMGNLESLVWFDATGWASLADPAALATLPPEVWRIALALALGAAGVALFWRPLVIATFDEGHARALGLPVGLIGAGVVCAAALAAVAAFAAVGAIIVIAMFICPPAAAGLVTRGLTARVWVSLAFAAVAAAGGYVLAGYGPLWLGARDAVSAAGMIAVLAGAILGLCALVGGRRA